MKWGFHVNSHVENKSLINFVFIIKLWETNLVVVAICDGNFLKFHLW
jgi:hypothetical protein